MPQIVSLLPTAPAASTAPVATSATPATEAASGTLLPADMSSPNFLAQFKAALKKTIAKVVVAPQPTQHPATDPNAAPLLSPMSEEPSATAATLDPTKPAADAIMPDLLAELGFAVVPLAFQLQTLPQAVNTPAGATTTPHEPNVLGHAQVGLSSTQTPLLQSASPLAAQPQTKLGAAMLQESVGQAPAAPETPLGHTPVAMPLGPVAAATPLGPVAAATPLGPVAAATPLGPVPVATPLGQKLADLHVGQTVPEAAATGAPKAPAAAGGPTVTDPSGGQSVPDALSQLAPGSVPVLHQPLAHLKPSDQPQSPTPAGSAQPTVATAPAVSAAAVVVQSNLNGQPVQTSTATPGPQTATPQQASQGGAQSGARDFEGTRDGHGRHTPGNVAAISSEAATVQTAPASDAAVAAAAATTAPAGAAPQSVQIGPSQVVAQIARQVDLIRLPGNRGLRIQLHPDDLGGVQVTLRYTPGGGVELHINAEQAATGALVQAGWPELRGALASQGISADRLTMTVTSPSGAAQTNLAGGGGNRSDHDASYSSNPSGQGNLTNQDSQGQSRQDNPQQRTSQRWGGTLEPVSAVDDNPRAASATAAPSRIDYRV